MATVKNIKKIYANGVMALTARKGARFAVKNTEFEVFDSITGNSITGIGMEEFYWIDNGISENDDRFSFFETYEEAVEFANNRQEADKEADKEVQSEIRNSRQVSAKNEQADRQVSAKNEQPARAVYIIEQRASDYVVNDGKPMTYKQVNQWRIKHQHSEVSDTRIVNIENGKEWRFDSTDTVSLRYGKIKWIAA